jgi:O-antigen biosynthesis protein
MRVALLTQNARAGDAIGRHVAEKVAYFLDRGAHVRVVVADDRDAHPAIRPLMIRQLDRAHGNGWDALRSADIVVVDYSQYYSLLDLLPLLADGKRRVVFDYHGVTPPLGRLANHRESQWRGRESRGLAGFADAVISHSGFAECELLEAATISPERRHRMGYFVGSDQFTPGDPAVSLQKRLNLHAARILLFVGRLAPNKRVPILIEALTELRGEMPAIHAVIVGPCGDCYESERILCREVAADGQVSDRVHFLGGVDDATLLDCYRSADMLVIPSVHEGFCLPLIEAMACGLPVIAARAGAMPETVGDAGLTFEQDDPSDLARSVKRTLSDLAESIFEARSPEPSQEIPTNRQSSPRLLLQSAQKKKVAIVTPGFGDAVGGAERSLSLIARLLDERGIAVEALTTKIEDQAPSLPVRQFLVEPIDPIRRAVATDQLESGDRLAEATYFANTLRSNRLIEALQRNDFDTVIVGPFGAALTRDVIRCVGERAILVPCLHHEAAAQTRTVRQMLERAGGVLYHSAEEKQLAQVVFGFNHPNAAVIGTWIDTAATGEASRGKQLAGTDRYVLVCGRKVLEKGLPAAIARARHYSARCPGRYRFVFVGEGDYPIPTESWALDLGRVSETAKRDLMAGATALVQLSAYESLSLVVLESMAANTPVIVNGDNPTLRAHVQQGAGGWTISNDAEFSAILDTLWDNPNIGIQRGRSGHEYVKKRFSDRAHTADIIVGAIKNLDRPIAELMRERGSARAKSFNRPNWRRAMDDVLEQVFDQPSIVAPSVVDLTASDSEIKDVKTWRVMVCHRGGLPLVPTGPGRSLIVVRIRSADGEAVGEEVHAAISSVIVPRQSIPVDVVIPELPVGVYGLEVGLRTQRIDMEPNTEWYGIISTLTITASPAKHELQDKSGPRAGRAIDAARLVQQLPDGYVDVSTGRLARIKRLIKNKLLQNFRTGYVDVLARQQSRFNHRVTDALTELADQPANFDLRADLAETKAHCANLQDRLSRLEAATSQEALPIGGEG